METLNKADLARNTDKGVDEVHWGVIKKKRSEFET